MAQKNRTYQISDEYDLNLRFYEGYDEAFLMDKASTLWMIVNRQDEFKQWTAQQSSTGEGVTAKYFEALRAEIYFTEFHQFEALFALLLSIYQSPPALAVSHDLPPRGYSRQSGSVHQRRHQDSHGRRD